MSLSVLIPARNEEWLKRTVDDVLANTHDATEVIVVADGYDPALEQHERLTVIRQPKPIGQRAATNMAARIATSRYVMKLDAHCRVGPGFDRILTEEAARLGPAVCQIPAQYNLHAFNWLCTAGHRVYQGPTRPCQWKPKGAPKEHPVCGLPVEREIIWERRRSKLTTSWRFDNELKFQYFGKHQDQHKTEKIHDVMSCLGACWFVDREHFFKLGALDETHGSWGQMGTELACKYWLSGGRMVVNKNTWYAHLFRTQGGDFTFPYPMSGGDQARARARSNHLWLGGNWPLATRSLESLVQQFPGAWKEEKANAVSGHERNTDMAKRETDVGVSISGSFAEDDSGQTLSLSGSSAPTAGCIWYTDHRPDGQILRASLDSLPEDLPVVRVGIEPASYVDIAVGGQRGYLTMFDQILTGLKAIRTDFVFFCEHDVLYHPSHFQFTPPRKDTFYYNLNVWKVDATTGRAITYITKQTSGLVAYRDLLIEHYTKRIELVKKHGFSRKMGFEPGSHGRKERVDDHPSDVFRSEYPNIDIRHQKNLTPSRWRQDQFRDQRNCRGWQESNIHHIEGWPNLPLILGDH
jgi:glycosyltransferase involved in cell wall biosynthesis